MFLPFVVLIVPAEARIGRNVTDPLHMHDALHRRSAGGNRDEIIAFGYRWTLALPAKPASATTAATPLRGAGKRFRGTKIQLGRIGALSSASTSARATCGVARCADRVFPLPPDACGCDAVANSSWSER